MSNSEENEPIGYGRPPRAHRFSADNQPRRSRKSAKLKFGGTHDINGHLLEALSEEVAVSQNGKAGKAKVMVAFAKRLVNQACKGSMADQIRFLKYLRDSGLFDVMNLKDQLEADFRERVREEEEKFVQALGLVQVTLETLRDAAQQILVATGEYLKARSKCSCGAFAGSAEVAEHFQQWHADAEGVFADRDDSSCSDSNGAAGRSGFLDEDPSEPDAKTKNQASSSLTSKSSKAQGVTQQGPDDPFYSGMIGND